MSTTPPDAAAGVASLLARAEAAGQAGQFMAARDAYADALRAMTASEPPVQRVRTLGGMGWALRCMGDPAAALGCFEQAFATQRRTDPGNHAGLATLHGVAAEALMALGRFDEALAEHEAALALDGATALARAGTLALAGEAAARAGRYGQARTHQDAALAALRALLPPGDPRIADALSKLGYSLLHLEEWEAAEAALREAVAGVPGHDPVTKNLMPGLVQQGRREEAYALGRDAYRQQSFVVQPPPARPAGTLLVLTSLEGNIPTEHLLPRLPLAVVDWHLDFSTAAHEALLPHYDAVLNIVGDADVGGAALRYADAFKERCAVPVLNDPARVLRTRRHEVGALLAGIPGLVTPRSVQLTGAALQADTLRAEAGLEARGLRFPVLLRAAGKHGGESVQRVEGAADLAAAAAGLEPDAVVYLTQYHEYASPDGLYRKYRAIFIDRAPMPYHLAISPYWLVHYFSAEMGHDDRVAEELAFLADMPGCLGPVATAALGAIARRLDLDYCGADFSLLPDGRVLLFESNATMLVHPEAPGSRHAGKNPFIDRILLAFEAMVMRRSGLAARP